MAEHRLNRRRVLQRAGALGAAGALAVLHDQAPAQAGGPEPSNSILGSWLATVTNNPDSHMDTRPFPAMVTFDFGGGMTETDLNGSGNGAWTVAGANTYRFRFLALSADKKGNFNGTAAIAGTITVYADGMTASGTDTVTFTDTHGKVLGSIGQTVTATRITA